MSHEPEHRRSGQLPSVHRRWERTSLWREDTSSSRTGRWSSHMVFLWWYQWESFGHQRCRLGAEKARRDEVEIIARFPVWEKIPRHKMPKGTKTIGTQWVDVNKQDEENPLYKPLSSPRGQEGLRFWWVLRGYAKFICPKMLVTIAVTFQLPHAGSQSKGLTRNEDS